MGRTRAWKLPSSSFKNISLTDMGNVAMPYIGHLDFIFLLQGSNFITCILPDLTYKSVNHDKQIKYLSPYGDVIDKNDNYYMLEENGLVFVKTIIQTKYVSFFDGRIIIYDGHISDLETGEVQEYKGQVNPYDPCYRLESGKLYYNDKLVKKYTKDTSFDYRLDAISHFDEYYDNKGKCYDNQGNVFYVVGHEIRFQSVLDEEDKDSRFEIPTNKTELLHLIHSLDHTADVRGKKVDDLRALLFELRQKGPKNYDMIDYNKEFKETRKGRGTILMLSKNYLLASNPNALFVHVYDTSDYLTKIQIGNIHKKTEDEIIKKALEIVYLNL